MEDGAFRFRLTGPPGRDPDEALALALGDTLASWTAALDGTLTVWVPTAEAGAVEEALGLQRFTVLEAEAEAPRDWVAEAAALQRPVACGPLLLDPHEGQRASRPGPRRRLVVPAETAFGTGSHESTRLALRLLLGSPVEGRAVLDVGCGAGTLAFAARLLGAGRVVGFDVDADAAFASRRNALRNGLDRCAFLAGTLEAFCGGAFDLVVANMLEEEVAPLLGGLRALLRRGGTLVTSGQLLEREAEFLALLRAEGFAPRRLSAEGEWLATASAAV